MAKKSATHRIARLEGICVGAGFLLKKLQAQYGADFGVGMTEQVRDCIRECDQVRKAQLQREKARATTSPATGHRDVQGAMPDAENAAGTSSSIGSDHQGKDS